MLYPESAVKVLKNRGLPPNMLAFPLHWHERIELTRVVSGNLDYNIDGYRFLLSAGQAAIVSPCRPHGAFSGENGTVYDTVMFNISDFYNRSEVSERFLAPVFSSGVRFVSHTSAESVINAIDRIISLDGSEIPFASLNAVGAVYELLAALYRECLSEAPVPQYIDPRFKNVFEYIADNFANPISVSQLSRKFGYNEAYFCRRFKELAGISATCYIRVLRLEKSKELLKKQFTVKEAAIQSGFSSISYFSGCFKKHFGMAPAEFVKNNIKQVGI